MILLQVIVQKIKVIGEKKEINLQPLPAPEFTFSLIFDLLVVEGEEETFSQTHTVDLNN